MVYFWLNGEAHFGPDWSSAYRNQILVYIGMTIIFLVWSGRGTQEQMRRPLEKSAGVFAIFFIGTYVILFFLSTVGLIVPLTLDVGAFWPTVIFNVCVVATAEELMFRGVLLEVLPWGVLTSSAMFAAWHVTAYGGNFYEFNWETFPWGSLFFAFIMGVLLALIAKKKELGLPATIAIHSCYNLVVVGAFVTFPQIVG